MNKKENIKEYTKNIHLSNEEKFEMLSHIRAHMNSPLTTPVQSPWYEFFAKKSFTYSTLAILFMTITTTSIIAEGAIPGNTLYSIKIHMNEPIVKAMHITDISKTKYSVEQTERRLEELSELIQVEDVDQEHIKIIFEQLDKHTSEIQDFLDESEYIYTEEVNAISLETKELFQKNISLFETLILEDKRESEESEKNTQETSILPTEEIESSKDEQNVSKTDETNSETEIVPLDTEPEEETRTEEIIKRLKDISGEI